MMARAAPSWLSVAYVAALSVHAGAVVLVPWLALGEALAGGANAAPDTLLFAALLMLPVLLSAAPSAIALLSWYLCRRQGVRPSAGHMALTTTAAGLPIFILVSAVLA